MGRNNRGSIALGMLLGLTLAVSGCAQKGSSNGSPGAGGAQQAAGPSGAGPAGTAGTQSAPAAGGNTNPDGAGGGSPAASAAGGAGAGSGSSQPAADGSGEMSSAGAAAPAVDGGAAPAGDGGATASSDGGTPPAHGDLGKGDGSDVITIGDSWMQIATNGGGIEGGLDRAGTSYRHYAIPGTTLINGDIPAQYDRAKAANPNIATVIMTGGGNDIMFTGGCNTKDACTMSVQMIVDALDQLWSTMADDGVKDVFFIDYSKYAGTAPADTRPDTAPTPPVCLSGRITCHSINTDDLVGPTDTVDGIHPTLPACDAIAKRTLDLMEMTGARR